MNKKKQFEKRVKIFQKYLDFYNENKNLFPGVTIEEITINTSDQKFDDKINLICKEYNKNKYWIPRIPEGEAKERFISNLNNIQFKGYIASVGITAYNELISQSFANLVNRAFDWHEGKFPNEESQSFWNEFSQMDIQ